MANFVIECPICGKSVMAGTGLFAKKKIKCSGCNYTIDVESEKLAEEPCPHCGNTVVYDRAKKDSATCPVCHNKIHAGTEKVTIQCPSCRIELTTDKNAATYTCPQCKRTIDVQAALAKKASSGKTSIVKWDMGQNNIFVYRHPVENFNIGSQLIVTEGQKAMFFRNGQGLDVFGPGRHVLETQKLPLLSELLKFPTDADLTWDSNVYFVRTNMLTVNWGIPSAKLRNPGMDFYVDYGISGSCKLRVIDDNESVRLLIREIIGAAADNNGEQMAVGGEESYTTEYVGRYFKDVISTRLPDIVGNIIRKNLINILDIETEKIFISDLLRRDMNQIFAEFGLVVPPGMFNVTDIRLHNSDEVQKWTKQESERVLRVREEEVRKAEAEAARERIMVEELTEAQRRILRTQGSGEEVKIAAAAKSEATKLEAQGDAVATQLMGHATADAYLAQAMAEAEEMRAKDYTYQQETSRMVGMEAMKHGLHGTNRGGGGATSGMSQMMSDMIGMGMTLGVMSEMAEMTKDMITPAMSGIREAAEYRPQPQSQPQSQPQPQPQPHQTNKVMAWNCTCGRACITSKFCPECGMAKSDIPDMSRWNCTCGCRDISSKFCPDCGSKRPEQPEVWNCPECGAMRITSKFCPECGHKKGE